MTSPTVSVVMSCYNGESFLPEAIESILLQTSKDLEFILIDDGSKDDTLAVIRRHAAKDNRIVVVEKENTGLADSLNVGIRIARGEWIARIDQDDIAIPHRIEAQLDYVRTYSDTILVGSGCIEIDQSGKERRRHYYPREHDQLTRHMERGGSPFPHSTAFFKALNVRQLGGYRIRMNGAEDVDLWLRMSASGEIRCLHEPLIKIRKHDASFTARNSMLAILLYAALVSHELRKLGRPDPIEEDNEICQYFLEWIKRQLIRENVFDVLDLLVRIEEGLVPRRKRQFFQKKSQTG